jgi:hypothetical protein
LNIRDHVEVSSRPTVVRLDDLQGDSAQWISDSYFVTSETARHLEALRTLFSTDSGCGVFLIGHYGSGKSHFLAYLTQQLRNKSLSGHDLHVLPISLLNYKAEQPLDSIIERELNIPREWEDRPLPNQQGREAAYRNGLAGGRDGKSHGDRRAVWKEVDRRYPEGVVLILDELSEYLRSKPSNHAFNEDLRFLQFLGEWAQGHHLWILAALQEQIEHMGEIEYDLFRKIKDRYPLRLLLTASHVRDLIARDILRKKDSYATAVESLVAELKQVHPDASIRYDDLCAIYPLHPATLELLEEVRDRFSQARGIVDFTLTQLLGNPARGIASFLDRPWGDLLTADTIVDHFADLFEVQPEFLPIAQKLLPYFRKQIPVLFRNEAQQDLAWRLIKLMILVHLSPRREALDDSEAAEWLLFKVSRIDPKKNREIIGKVLSTLATQGSYVKQQDTRFHLDVADDSNEHLERLLVKTIEEIGNRGDFVFESLVPLLDHADFNPFALPRDRWHIRRVRWHFHDWDLQVYFGGGTAPQQKGLSLQLGIPWGRPASGNCARVLPSPMEVNAGIIELAALYQLKDRPLPAGVLSRIEERVTARTPWFCSLIRTACLEATVVDGTGAETAAPLRSLPSIQGGHSAWLNAYGEWLLRQTYPLFERFAPGSGPLPKEAYRQFMKFASEQDLGAQDAPDFVKLIREAYLVPMGLMQRKGSEYVMSPKLESHELVRLLSPVLQHHPSPARVYEHMSAPVYGLVPDQIHLLLLVLLIQGELDIVKGEQSYRDTYDTLVNPLQYDKILPGRALSVTQLRTLETLCQGFRIPIPKQWSVLAQKRAVAQLRKFGSNQRDVLSSFVTKLKEYGEAAETVAQAESLISKWIALEKGDHELQGLQHFELAIGSAQRFIAEANEMASLPQRFERLLRETQRFRHLFSDPAIAGSTDPEIATRLEAMPPSPPLSEPEALNAWLENAQLLYQKYQLWYRERHEQWYRDVCLHPIWSYQIPAIAQSRHLMVDGLVRQLQSLIDNAKLQRCSGLTSLDFQAVCRCSFDGSGSALSETLQSFEITSGKLEDQIGLFFQQDSVKSKVREWVDQGIELSTATLSYLEGKSKYPGVANLSLFDQHLSGLELVKPVDTGTLADFLGDRVWERAALIDALKQFFDRVGPRIVLRREQEPRRNDLVAWCYEQALSQGRPLPAVFSRAEQDLAAQLIDARWIGEASLRKLEDLKLGEPALLRVLDMILNGLVRTPDGICKSGPVAAALELVKPQSPDTAGKLAERIDCLYAEHERFMKLRPERWLELLDKLAKTDLAERPANLEMKLREHLDAQWIVVDCLGLPIAGTVARVVSDCMTPWRSPSLDFAYVSERTSTEAFYLTLIEQKFRKPFEKIDSIDHLIHQRNLSPADLLRLARAELEIAFKRLLSRLDPAKAVVIFGDHGFRLTPDGVGFTHGGPSTLERLTVVLRLS